MLNCDILIKYISTHDQVFDIFTKGLFSTRFLTLKSKLMVVAPPINLRGAVNICKDSTNKATTSQVNANQSH